MTKRWFGMSAVSSALALCGVLAFGSTSRGESQGPCSDRTIQGEYAFAIEGQGLINGQVVPLRGVAMTEFDGVGNLSQVDHVVFNYQPPATEWRPGTGTYSVNPDCTGTAQLNNEGSTRPVNLRFVVAREGKEIRTVVNGGASSSVGIKRE